MRKLFMAISLVAMLGFVAVPANALVGVPDDVPGTDILVPFFYVSMPGHGNENTLVTITDTKALGGYLFPIPDPDTDLHLTFYTIDSFPASTMSVALTWFDVWSMDMLTIINNMSVSARNQYRIDTNGDGIFDHWAGYLHAFNNDAGLFYGGDALISHCYQVMLPAGMAVGFNGVSWEWDFAFDVNRQLILDNLGILTALEAFSANALWSSRWLEANAAAPVQNAQWFRLMPRYYVHDAVGQSMFMIWIEAIHSRALTPWGALTPIPLPGLIHCYFFNEDEDVQDSYIPLIHELNILNVRDFLPIGLFPGGAYPWAGWVDIATPDDFGGGWNSLAWNPVANANQAVDVGAYRNWVGYSWQRAVGPAAEAWEVIHPMHREAGVDAKWIPAPWW